MDWQKMGGQDPWGGHNMSHHVPWMGGGVGMKMAMMRCPVCGEPLFKPTKEELVEMMERKKKRLLAAVEHLDKEIERLKTVQM